MVKGNNQVPERLINCMIYNKSKALVGTGEVELPSLEAMTDTVTGAGIAGEIDSPVLGHYGSLGLTITFRTIENDVVELAAPKAHQLEIYGSQQSYDASTGEYKTTPVRVAVRAIPKNVSFGTFEPGATTDTEAEFEVTYIKVTINKKEVCEVDKLNFIAKFNGEDYLSSVRSDLGLN